MPPNHYCGYTKTDARGRTEIIITRDDHMVRYTLPELAEHFAVKTGPYSQHNSN